MPEIQYLSTTIPDEQRRDLGAPVEQTVMQIESPPGRASGPQAFNTFCPTQHRNALKLHPTMRSKRSRGSA